MSAEDDQIPQWRASIVGRLAGITAEGVHEILRGWEGNRLSRLTDQEVADEITARLDDLAKDP